MEKNESLPNEEWYKNANAEFNARMADYSFFGQQGGYNSYVMEARKYKSNMDPLQTMGYLHAQETIDSNWDYFRNLSRSAYNGGVGVIRDTMNGIRAARDYNIAMLNEQAKAQGIERNPDQRFIDAMDNAVKVQALQPYDVKPSSSALGQFGLDVAQGAGQLVGQAVGSVVAESLFPGVGGLALMVGQITGGQYEDLKAKGVDPQRAAEASFANAMIQAPFERLSLARLMRKVPAGSVFKKKMKMVWEDMATEGITEFIQQFPEEWAETWATNPNRSWKELREKAAEKFPDTLQNAMYAGLIGAVLGAGARGIHIAMDKDIDLELQKEVHRESLDAMGKRINSIKESGIDPNYAGETINANLNNAMVMVDGDVLFAFAQKVGAEEIAEKLGVTVDAIEQAADDGDVVEIAQGNFEAMSAASPGFFEAMKDSLTFDEQDISNRKQEILQKNIERYTKLAEEQRNELNAEVDKIAATMEEAGVEKKVVDEWKNIFTAFALNARPDNPVQFLRDNALRFERGMEQRNNALYQTSTQIAAKYPNWMDNQVIADEEGKKGQSTQTTTTIFTYRKLGDYIKNNLPQDAKILDASSGLGLGTLELRNNGVNVEDIEPYPGGDRMKNNPPTYSGVDAYEQARRSGKQYDFIISNAVLNVIPDDWRQSVLHDMASLLKVGGKMFINVRKKGEEKGIKNKIELDSPQEVLVGTPDKIVSYQRFYTPQELAEYVKSELGDAYEVEVANVDNSGTKGLPAVVVIKKQETPDGYYQRTVEQTEPERDLVAYHNMSEDSVLKSAALGGLPVPSIAVTRKDVPFNQFGQITLIGGSDIIDPARYGNDVYSRDAWTTTFPEVVYDKVKIGDIRNFRESVKDAFKAFGNEGVTQLSEFSYKLEGGRIRRHMQDDLYYSLPMRYKFITDELGDSVKISFKTRSVQDEFILKNKKIRDVLKEAGYEPSEENLKKVSDIARSAVEKYAEENVPQKKTITINGEEYTDKGPSLNGRVVVNSKGENQSPGISLAVATLLERGNVENSIKHLNSLTKSPLKSIAEKAKNAIEFINNSKIENDDLRQQLLDIYFDKNGLLKPRQYESLFMQSRRYGEKELDRSKVKGAIDKKIDKHEKQFTEFINRQLDKLYRNPQIMVGNKKKDVTLENIVDAMIKKRGAGKEDSFVFNNHKAVASMAKKFKSLDEIRKNKNQLTDSEKADLSFKVFEDITDQYRKDVAQYHKYKNESYLDVYDDANKVIVDAAKGGGTEQAIRSALRKNYFNDVPDSIVEQVKNALAAAKEIQTDYFEAKPLRAVGFNEFSAAVVPKGTKKETIDFLKSQGLAVTKYDPNVSGDRFAKTQQAAEKAKVYFQQEGMVKGSFDPFTNGEAIIKLFKGADASTIIHETGHYYIESLWREIMNGNATDQQKADFEKLMNYCGITTDKWAGMSLKGREAAHERLAEAIETYIMEDKAPTRELRPVFKRFAKWLKSVYSAISRNKNAVPLTNEVREVFDRMLASEEDVEEMKRVEGYFAKLPSAITDNLSDATKRRIEDYIVKAQDKAVEILTKERLANFRESRQEEIEKYRDEISDSIKKEISNQPLYVAARNIQDILGGEKPAPAKSYARQYVDNKMSPERIVEWSIIAEQYGFQPGELAAKLIDEPNETEAYNEAMKKAVNDKFPDYYTEKEQAEEATRMSMYNDESGVLLGVEQVLIEDFAVKAKAQQRSAEASRKLAMAKRQQATVAAKNELATKKLKDAIKVKRYIDAERRCAVKSAEAMAKKDYETARKYKDMQAFNHAMVIESATLRKKWEQNQKYLRKQIRSKKESWTSDQHFNQAAALFARMGYPRKDYYPETQTQTLQEYLDEMGGEFYEFGEIPGWLADGMTPITRSMEMTFEDYQSVIDLVRYIKTMARIEKGVNTFNSEKSYGEWKENALDNLNKLDTKFVPVLGQQQQPTLKDRFDSAYQTLDNFLEKMDGWHYGFFSKSFGEAIKHANDNEFVHVEAYEKRLAEVENAWCPTKESVEEKAKGVYYEELGTVANKFVLTKMLMNLGNEGNARRLCGTLPSEDLRNSSLWVFPNEGLTKDEAIAQTKENLIEFLGKVLTKEDIAYAQGKIDIQSMYWDEMAAMNKRTRGFAPPKVEAYPVMLQLANGEKVIFRGGYFPLIRNGEMGSHPAGTMPVSETDPKQGKNIRTMHTDTGRTKARVDASYPVDLSEGAEDRAMRQAIHDLCWRETMTEFRRILNDPMMYGMMKTKLGPADMRVFREMLEHAAQPNGSPSMAMGESLMSQTAGWLRRKTVNSIVMLNVRINLQNFGNFFLYGNSVEGFGYGDVISAMGNAMNNGFEGKSFAEMWAFVDEKSAFMRSRSENPDITLAQLREEGKLNEYERTAMEWGAKAMMYTDGLTARPVWMQAYYKKLNAGATEQEAIDFADTIIRRTLGSGRVTDVASLQRGTPTFKLFTAFQGFFNTQFNQWVREYNVDRRMWKEGNKQEAVKNITAFVASKYLAACLFNIVLALENPFDDDDDKLNNLEKEILHYPMSLVGIFGPVANFMVDKTLGLRAYSYRMSIIESSLDKVYRAGGKMHKIVDGDFVEALEGMTDVVGIGLGVPAQMNRLFWNAYDIFVNGMEPELRDFATRRPKRERK